MEPDNDLEGIKLRLYQVCVSAVKIQMLTLPIALCMIALSVAALAERRVTMFRKPKYKNREMHKVYPKMTRGKKTRSLPGLRFYNSSKQTTTITKEPQRRLET
jgi:hypothetical protein